MDKPYVGERVPLRAEFHQDDGTPMAATGVEFVVRKVDGSFYTLAPGVATDEAHVFTASVLVTASGTWEAQGRCTGPVETYTPRVRFEVARPLDFTPPN